MKNIVLTGFMACGKSTVGRRLAKRLHRRFVDTDALIVEREQRSVAQIFAEDGEERFRALERQVAIELGQEEDLVIATGGKMMLDEVCVQAFAGAHIFTLTASPEEILYRVLKGGIGKRPLLNVSDPGAKIRQLLEERREGYGRFQQIATDGGNVMAVVKEITSRL